MILRFSVNSIESEVSKLGQIEIVSSRDCSSNRRARVCYWSIEIETKWEGPHDVFSRVNPTLLSNGF
jgi:hypothetical protein